MKKYINIFTLTFILLINISFIANVSALSETKNENGEVVKCILNNSLVENKDKIDRDYCLTFNTNYNGKKYAKYIISSAKNYYIPENFSYMIINTSGNYQPYYNYTYDSDMWIFIFPELIEYSADYGNEIYQQTDYKLLQDIPYNPTNSKILNVIEPIFNRKVYNKPLNDNSVAKSETETNSGNTSYILIKISNNSLTYTNSITKAPRIKIEDLDNRLIETNMKTYIFKDNTINWDNLYDSNLHKYKEYTIFKDEITNNKINSDYEEIEDKTEEETQILNNEKLKLNNNVTTLEKNTLIKLNKGKLQTLILITFITTILIIIRSKI